MQQDLIVKLQSCSRIHRKTKSAIVTRQMMRGRSKIAAKTNKTYTITRQLNKNLYFLDQFPYLFGLACSYVT